MVGELIRELLDEFQPLSTSGLDRVKDIRKSIRDVMKGQTGLTLFRVPIVNRLFQKQLKLFHTPIVM